MKIVDEGIIISKSIFGETSLIIKIFSSKYGIISGLYKGGLTSKNKYLLELGNIVDFEKSSRLDSQLGMLKIDLKESYLFNIFHNKLKLTILITMLDLIKAFIVEKENIEDFYFLTKNLIIILQKEDEIKNYLLWELKLLEAIGFGLDLSKCVITLKEEGLYYLSPKTGKSVIKDVGEAYHNKLFIIPKFFLDIKEENIAIKDLELGFKINTHFLDNFAKEYNKIIPSSRNNIMKIK